MTTIIVDQDNAHYIHEVSSMNIMFTGKCGSWNRRSAEVHLEAIQDNYHEWDLKQVNTGIIVSHMLQ